MKQNEPTHSNNGNLPHSHLSHNGNYLLEEEMKKKVIKKICKNCRWWCPYNKIWGDCSRRVPQYNIKFDDHCKSYEEAK